MSKDIESHIRKRIASLEQTRERLFVLLESNFLLLNELKAAVGDQPLPPDMDPTTLFGSEWETPPPEAGLSPTDAIVRLLQQANRPLTAKEILDQLQDVVKTETGNPRKAISSTLSMLVKRSRVEHYNGTYFLKTQEKEDEDFFYVPEKKKGQQ